jgi:hypothetical protein
LRPDYASGVAWQRYFLWEPPWRLAVRCGVATIRKLTLNNSGTTKTRICQVHKGVVKGNGSTSALGVKFNTPNCQVSQAPSPLIYPEIVVDKPLASTTAIEPYLTSMNPARTKSCRIGMTELRERFTRWASFSWVR